MAFSSNRLVCLGRETVHVLRDWVPKSQIKVLVRPTCVTLVGSDEIAIGFENSVILVVRVIGDKLQTLFEIDHKMETQAIQTILYEPSFLTVALNGVGIFKWLCARGNSLNPEHEKLNATLVQAIPVARGYQLNKMIR